MLNNAFNRGPLVWKSVVLPIQATTPSLKTLLVSAQFNYQYYWEG